MPRILIVDDSISVRKALEITFKRHNLDSVSVVSGEQALETLLNTPATFDLIMLDVIMPGMSGLELCLTLRHQERFQHLPIVLMSGNVDDEIRQQAREVRANGVLRKPFSPDELIPMVEHLLSEPPPVQDQHGQPQHPQPQRSEPPHEPHSESPPTPEALAQPPAAQPSPAQPPTAQVSPPATTEQVARPAALAAPMSQPAPQPAQPTPPAAPAPPPTTPPSADPLADLKALLRAYHDRPDIEDLLLLDPHGQVSYHSGSGLSAQLLTYARYFTTTAQIIGQQLLKEELQSVSLKYQGRSVHLHVVSGYTVIAMLKG